MEAVPGEAVALTLVRDIGWKAQDLVDKAVSETGADYAIAVVQNVKTQEILALADSGRSTPTTGRTRGWPTGAAPSGRLRAGFDGQGHHHGRRDRGATRPRPASTRSATPTRPRTARPFATRTSTVSSG
ncbi:hypothetical protein NKG05_00330 [Oerskovia sp. M15]